VAPAIAVGSVSMSWLSADQITSSAGFWPALAAQLL
jgi:hypothetical protein